VPRQPMFEIIDTSERVPTIGDTVKLMVDFNGMRTLEIGKIYKIREDGSCSVRIKTFDTILQKVVYLKRRVEPSEFVASEFVGGE